MYYLTHKAVQLYTKHLFVPLAGEGAVTDILPPERHYCFQR